jgi:A/G-specific adenine glycosylase
MQADFTRNLLQWHETENDRQMPWKGETDPYKIWLSEIILQQTRVEQGRSYYEKFIRTYPDVHALAQAPEQEVYKLWEGLGYYSRCRNLLKTARTIVFEYGGKFPTTYNEIILLSGIGPYTAAAISSFAFNEKRAVVDGNVQRILARYFGITTPVDTPAGKKMFNELANALIAPDSPATFNQAIMDFGATICRPRNPLCTSCVVRNDCEAYRNHFVHAVPVKEKILKIKNRWLYYFIIETGNGVFIRKRTEKDIWQNLHEFVLYEQGEENDQSADEFLSRLLQHQSYAVISKSSVYSQQLTHQKIKGRFIHIYLNGHATINNGYHEVEKSQLSGYAFPRFINSYLEKDFFRTAVSG